MKISFAFGSPLPKELVDALAISERVFPENGFLLRFEDVPAVVES
jgi:hypothetical protein